MKKTSSMFLIMGISIALFSVLADAIGLGKGGIQAAQLLGLQIGIFVVLVGWGLWIAAQSGSKMPTWGQILVWGEHILDLPVVVWFLASFLGVYFVFFCPACFLE